MHNAMETIARPNCYERFYSDDGEGIINHCLDTMAMDKNALVAAVVLGDIDQKVADYIIERLNVYTRILKRF